MPAPDARTRSRIQLNPTKVFSPSVPRTLLPHVLLSNVFLALAVHMGKEWLLFLDVGIFWIVMRVLSCAGLGILVWEAFTGQIRKKHIEYSVLAMASLLLFVKEISFFTALYRLSTTRVILLAHFAPYWTQALLNTGTSRQPLATGAIFLLSFLSDIQFSMANVWHYLPPYGALALHAVSSMALEHTCGILIPSLGVAVTLNASTLGAALFALPLYGLRTILLGFPTTPILPLSSLATIPVLAFTLLFLSPMTVRNVNFATSSAHQFGVAYPTATFATIALGVTVFSRSPSWMELILVGAMYYGVYPTHSDSVTPTARTPTSRLIRSYLKTILSNPESRKIFYFLMLNMCYMLVQMLYGVWTNSLGLISDAIHMAFDCMAIGVGLLASVMATWEPNVRFTYGYGRIETLSGFANGIFLILISIFIVFEAIQRLLDPPEMNTSQLLLVSSLGLAVNLFGMFAMGGHHHHGGHSHSHSHSHSQDHGHDHSHALNEPPNHSHSHSHDEDSKHHHDDHSDHSHSHSHSNDHPPHHEDHSHSHIHSDDHSHSHSPPDHSHSHSHSHADGHASAHDDHPTRKTHRRTDSERRRPPPLQGLSDHPVSPVPSHLMQPDAIASPITPQYHFGADEHYQKHHHNDTPNLNNYNHAPDHSHEGHSHNMRGVFLHVMADTLGSVGVIISTLLIQFYGWTGFDPIASLFIAIMIAASVIPLVIDTGRVLCLDVTDREVAIEEALQELSSIEGLSSYSSARFWPKDASSLIGSIHVQLKPSAANFDPTGPHSAHRHTYTSLDRVVERVDAVLKKRIHGLEELTIQVGDSGYR